MPIYERFMNKCVLAILFSLLCVVACAPRHKAIIKTDANGFKYLCVTNDPFLLRIYELPNGMKLYLSKNEDTPQIYADIVVNVGSVSDPEQNTGLAHYLEHLMYKGSKQIGTINWEKEAPLLEEIANLYELHRADSTPEGKLAIYKQIDSVSHVASQYTIPNEYDNIIGQMAIEYNAMTGYESTEYYSIIHSDELEKWMKLEAERIFDVQLRLFQPELETVYEEYNSSIDDDYVKCGYALQAKMFPNHPYSRTILGKPEHLRNPSIKDIDKFIADYYTPNNMAIFLSGDFDYEEAVVWANQYFGNIPSHSKPTFEKIILPDFTEALDTTIYGQEPDFLCMGYRLDGFSTDLDVYTNLVTTILYNGVAGLFDVNLNRQQKVLEAIADYAVQRDYSMLQLLAWPNQDQSLEETRSLLLEEVEKIKRGEFDEWMIKAAINIIKKEQAEIFASNQTRTELLVYEYISDINPADRFKSNAMMERITKADIVRFANENLNFPVTTYKRMGVDTSIVTVERPLITHFDINRDTISDFNKLISSMPTKSIKPHFVDFRSKIKSRMLADGVEFSYVHKDLNDNFFELELVVDLNKQNNKIANVAADYLTYIGTDSLDSEQLSQELFKNGLAIQNASDDHSIIIKLSGIEDNLEIGVKLLEHLLSSCRADSLAFDDYIVRLGQLRLNNKQKAECILNAMKTYAIYGKHSLVTDEVSTAELETYGVDTLVDMIRTFTKYPHKLRYCGNSNYDDVVEILQKNHTTQVVYNIPKSQPYNEQEIKVPAVYFVNNDKVQTDVIVLKRGRQYTPNLLSFAEIYNVYYGEGSEGLMFQTIRETKGLGYDASTKILIPDAKDGSFYSFSHVTTQNDKTFDVIDEMLKMLNNVIRADNNFNIAKNIVKKRIATQRIPNTKLYCERARVNRYGVDFDIRENVYNRVSDVSFDDFAQIFNNDIAQSNEVIMVLGSKKMIDINRLSKYGKVVELSVDELFENN